VGVDAGLSQCDKGEFHGGVVQDSITSVERNFLYGLDACPLVGEVVIGVPGFLKKVSTIELKIGTGQCAIFGSNVLQQLHDGDVGVAKNVVGQHIILCTRGHGFEHLFADGFGDGLMCFEVAKLLIILAICHSDLGACSIGCVHGLWARM
jgi:hypothetical protein